MLFSRRSKRDGCPERRASTLFGTVTPRLLPLGACLLFGATLAHAQSPPADEDTRAAAIAAQQQEKAGDLRPYEPNRAEQWVRQAQELLTGQNLQWHPFFESAYRGGGFTLGAGYLQHLGDYQWADVRGSFTPSGYLRFEGEYRAARLFNRRGELSIVGGWRKATEVGYYGLGTAETSLDSETFYSFTQPYLSSTIALRPTRRWLLLTGGAEYSQWRPGPGEGPGPSIETTFTPDTAPGLGAEPVYLQLFGELAVDSRPAAGYTRRGGYYAVSAHQYLDADDRYSFQRIDYEAIQHVPIGRDAWVLSLRGKLETTNTSGGRTVPFFMMPALGGGSDLRGFNSWRFRDLHSLLLQAEWRVLVNGFFDTALFYDAGKVTSRRSDLDFSGLKSDYGIGFRVHGFTATPLRIDVARSNEGFHFVFSASAVF